MWGCSSPRRCVWGSVLQQLSCLMWSLSQHFHITNLLPFVRCSVLSNECLLLWRVLRKRRSRTDKHFTNAIENFTWIFFHLSFWFLIFSWIGRKRSKKNTSIATFFLSFQMPVFVSEPFYLFPKIGKLPCIVRTSAHIFSFLQCCLFDPDVGTSLVKLHLHNSTYNWHVQSVCYSYICTLALLLRKSLFVYFVVFKLYLFSYIIFNKYILINKYLNKLYFCLVTFFKFLFNALTLPTFFRDS